ncbi:ATP-grasp fold amidoligase family protein [Enterobacter cancerogenus]|uniref:ATP-grasp fold amidoligase family protein n=1 Tax=Enterobacter cancerogenus TaxID=69218 RepID=UPI0005369971|nr:ATP-grasp fold amidoligase family protein [Enterobacter cancerogenus]KGT92698.1 glycosyltransferase [Enterobacter cancerogenus]
MNKKTNWFGKRLEYKLKEVRFLLIDDYDYKDRKFRKDFSAIPNLNNPTRFNEKVIYRMLYDNNEMFGQLADKVNARKHVAEVAGEEYLVPLIGVYNTFDDINFSTFPKRFVIKCSHDSGSYIICHDISEFCFHEAKRKINFFLSRNMYIVTREKHYRDIEPKIICEAYIDVFRNRDRDITPELYRFHCFNGEPRYIEADFTDSQGKEYVNVYNMDWQKQVVTVNYPVLPKAIAPPDMLPEMVALSRKLSAEFDYCRIDLFLAGDKIYFNEFTFTPGAGRIKFKPASFDYLLGSLW